MEDHRRLGSTLSDFVFLEDLRNAGAVWADITAKSGAKDLHRAVQAGKSATSGAVYDVYIYRNSCTFNTLHLRTRFVLILLL
eukprot:scaffold121502_cov35-Prasinocladus_malaysianus.AAC.1